MSTLYISDAEGPEALTCVASDEPVRIEIWHHADTPEERSLIINEGDDIIVEIPLTPTVRTALIKALS
jgi:hypothetical protein